MIQIDLSSKKTYSWPIGVDEKVLRIINYQRNENQNQQEITYNCYNGYSQKQKITWL